MTVSTICDSVSGEGLANSRSKPTSLFSTGIGWPSASSDSASKRRAPAGRLASAGGRVDPALGREARDVAAGLLRRDADGEEGRRAPLPGRRDQGDVGEVGRTAAIPLERAASVEFGDGVERGGRPDGVDVVGDAAAGEPGVAVAPLADRHAGFQVQQSICAWRLREGASGGQDVREVAHQQIAVAHARGVRPRQEGREPLRPEAVGVGLQHRRQHVVAVDHLVVVERRGDRTPGRP